MDNPFKNLFKKQSGSVLGIDIGSSAIKVVQIKKSGSKAILETYGELALGPYGGVEIGQATNLPVEKIIEAVSDLMREKEVNIFTNKCGIAIPFASSLMSLIEMPLLSYKQLSAMIPLEARKYIPVPISEVALDWSIIPREEITQEEDSDDDDEAKNAIKKVDRTDVLLVAIHNDTISRYQEIIAKTGLESSFFEIEIFSTMRAVLDNDQHPLMIFDMGAASTKLYIVERGVVRISHTINRGSQDVTTTISKSLGISVKEAEILKRSTGAVTSGEKDIKEVVNLSLAYIFSEANQVILNYQKKYNKTLAKIILVGGGSSLRGIQALAQANFQIEVVAGDPFKKVEAPAFLEDVLKETGPEFAVAVGLALRRLQEMD
jgi:type IV pilus assembly protein PilM